MKPQISILGCGWFGLPLAKTLINNGFQIKGSTTTTDKLTILENTGINPFLITLEANSSLSNTSIFSINFEKFLEHSNILLIAIPPKLRAEVKENFVSKIINILPFVEKSSIEEVIFISSTSVYGKNNLVIDEESVLNPDTESGIQLAETEQILLKNTNFKTTIVRFGGLIGEDRHPVRFLSGKTNIENPNSPINLIHLDDCIGIILSIIEKFNCNSAKQNHIYNAVAPFHPSRKEYYTQKALEMNLSLPEFSIENIPVNEIVGRIIFSKKIENELNYTFKKPNL